MAVPYGEIEEGYPRLLPPFQRFRLLGAGLVHHLRQSDVLNPAHALISRRNDSPSALLQAIRNCHAYNEFTAAQRAHARRAGARAPPLSMRGWMAACGRSWVASATGRMGAMIGPHQRMAGGVDRVLAMADGPARRAASAWRSGVWNVDKRCQCGEPFNRGHFACLTASTHAFAADGPLGADALNLEQQRFNWEQQLRTQHHGITVNGMDFALGHEDERWNTVAMEVLAWWDTLMEALVKVDAEQ
ncbi:hypothetical protein OC835_001417 [Tilletia horrida]|nr:hypothetical protein OC835_001417 [Tilletia horrida]